MALLTSSLYHDRLRFGEVDFNTYYAWTKAFVAGTNPWRVVVCNYTPAFIVFFSPLVRMSPPAAFWIWQAIQAQGSA